MKKDRPTDQQNEAPEHLELTSPEDTKQTPQRHKRVTEKQLAANRANAQKSTGPKTDEGKRRCALNALRHGLTAQVTMLPGEDLEAYNDFCRKFRESLQPVGFVEEQLAQSLAEVRWRLTRVSQLENSVFSLGFELYGDRYIVEHPEAHVAITNAVTLIEHQAQLVNLSILGQRLSRQFSKEMAELRALQSARQVQHEAELQEAYKLAKCHKVIEKPYNPAEDGFVFSNEELQTYMTRRDRRSAAHEAAGRAYEPDICRKLTAETLLGGCNS
jgi:hypothetical protein